VSNDLHGPRHKLTADTVETSTSKAFDDQTASDGRSSRVQTTSSVLPASCVALECAVPGHSTTAGHRIRRRLDRLCAQAGC